MCSSTPTNATSAATSDTRRAVSAGRQGERALRVVSTALVAAGTEAEGRRGRVGGTLVVPDGPDQWPWGEAVFAPSGAGR